MTDELDPRQTHRLPIPLPKGFDPEKHQAALLAKVTEKYGPGFEIVSIDLAEHKAMAVRQPTIAEVSHVSKNDSFDVRLARGTQPTHGPKVDAKLADQYPGYYMVRFEPFLGKATLARLTEDEVRCRGAIAVALGVQPWEVGVKGRPDGGFEVDLPNKYQPSKADKIQEVADSIVGREGWYAQIDAQKLKASLIPADPPTFPGSFPTPVDRLGADPDHTPFARALPAPGEEVGPEIHIDWTNSAWALLGGLPGAGKTVTINAILADQLASGASCVIIDDQSKAVDFEWVKPYVRDHGWGCDSLEHAVAALGLVREEGARRAKVLKDKGLNNWLDLPPGERFEPIFIVFDEASAVLVPEPKLQGIPKDHPLYLENERTNLAKALIGNFTNKIIAELRFVGVRMVLATQVTNANTGIGPSTRSKMGHFLLQGTNPSKSARNQMFADEQAVPVVPENVKASGKAALGVGVCDLGGAAPVVYKGYFASVNDYTKKFNDLGLRKTSRPAPTSAQIDKFLPQVEDDEPQGGRRGEGNGPRGSEVSPVSGRTLAEIGREMGDPNVGWDRDEDGNRLSGFERANAARAAVVRGAQQPPSPDPVGAGSGDWAGQ